MRQDAFFFNTVAIARHPQFALRVWVADVAGNLIDLTTLDGIDWISDCRWNGGSVDQPVATFEISLRRDVARAGTVYSLAPLHDNSLNVGGALLDVGRELVIEVSSWAPPTAVPLGGTWREVFRGDIDRVKWDADPIQISGRDLGGRLADLWIEKETSYAPDVLENVIQAILDEWAPGVTLLVPSPSAFFIPVPDQKRGLRSLPVCYPDHDKHTRLDLEF